MRFFSIVSHSAIAFLISVQSLQADCFVCDEVVEFDAVRAACYLSEYSAYIDRAKEEASGRVEIDLTDCAGTIADNSRGLSAFPFFPEQKNSHDGDAPIAIEGLRSVYILEEEALTCLKDYLLGLESPIDPSLTIDLIEDCQ